MIGASNRRPQLKSNLLAGAAGLAAAAMSTAAFADAAPASGAPSSPPADPPKWLPSVDIGGAIGDSFTAGRIDAFVPAWQDLDSMLFVRVGFDTLTKESENYNLGVGYRTKIDPDWILGVFAGFDSSQTDFSHTFNQVSLGAELMSADWDVHLNGYFANKNNKPIANKFALYIHDTTIAILQGQEAAFSGFDGEVGYRVFSTDNTDVRVFAGGYSFHHSGVDTSLPGHNFSFDYQRVDGYKARAEVNVFDLDMLGPQSRLSIDGGISHDQVDHTSGYVGATLRIPIDAVSGSGAQALSEIDRRMADEPRRRDNVLTQWQYNKPEPVIIYNGTITSEPTNTLYYVDNSAGAGTYADPTTLKDATDRGPVNQFIVLTDRDGAVNSTGVTVQSGESVVGPGVFDIRGAYTGAHFTHDFAPSSGPVTVTTADGITVSPDTNLFGFTIDSTATNAIYGHNVDDVVIGDVLIDGGGVGGNGIVFVQDTGSGTVTIDDTTIQNMTGDAIDATVTGAGGSTSFGIDITNLTTTGIAGNGVDVSAAATGGGSTSTYVGIHDSSITAGVVGVAVSSTADATSTASQTLVIDPTTINGGYFGIYVEALSYGGTVTQNVSITDTTVNDALYAGVVIGGVAANGGHVYQTVNIDDLTVHGGGITYYPLVIAAIGVDGGAVTQNVIASHVTVDNGYYDNILIQAYAGYGSTVHQYVAMDHVTTTGSVSGDGLFIRAEAYDDATVVQSVTANYLTSTGNYDDGVGIFARADNYFAGDTAVTAQYVTLTDATITGNGFDGVIASVGGFDDSIARQDVTISDSTIFVTVTSPIFHFCIASLRLSFL